jgi:competence protein ComEC
VFGQPKGRKIPQKPKAKNKLIYGIVIALLMVVALVSGRMRTRQIRSVVRSDAPFQIHVIDVGQGDSILLLADGHAMLLDAGIPDAGHTVAEYLDLLNITELDYAAVTHLHSDHIGGFAAAVKNRKVQHFAEPVTPETLVPDDTVYQMYASAVKDVQQLHDGDSFTLGGAKIDVLAPLDAEVTDLNDTSLVLRVQYQDTVCLLTGDMEEAEEQALLERHPDLKADLLKVAHHGSASSTSEAFLEAVQPAFAAISCGKDNDYGHPAPETLARLQKAGAQVSITAEQGHLAYIYENGTLQCCPQRPEVQS